MASAARKYGGAASTNRAAGAEPLVCNKELILYFFPQKHYVEVWEKERDIFLVNFNDDMRFGVP